jgi:threonylcarbamoyladenosine tRNA methylthiotransferase MtaB
MIVGFHTFGCKLNQYETESIAQALGLRGAEIVSAREEADFYIINTCTVTARADHKARTFVRNLVRSRQHSFIVVTGCSAQMEAAEFSGIDPRVIVVPQSQKAVLLGLPGADAAAILRDAMRIAPGTGRPDPFTFESSEPSFHSRAFLKIQDGCDNRCAYCRVPLARGPSVSLPLQKAVERARGIEARGYREIVMTGVNISAYRSGENGLGTLLRALLGSLTRARLRLSSLEPEAITGEFADILSHPRICAHFHLAVQSGSDNVLAGMRRRYKASQIEEAVSLLRGVKNDPFLAADMLVGFPGETDEDFKKTKRMAEGLDFSSLHVFPFSPRKGTKAADLRGRISESAATRRAAELGALSGELAEGYRKRWAGREVEVLIEKKSAKKGFSRGVSSNYLKVRLDGLPDGVNASGMLVRAGLFPAKSDRAGVSALMEGAFLGFID